MAGVIMIKTKTGSENLQADPKSNSFLARMDLELKFRVPSQM